MRQIIQPTIAAMARMGAPFVGVLFAGLMLTEDGPKLIEYNVRFGDPEAQAILPLFASDLGALLLACAKGELSTAIPPQFRPGASVAVVLAAKGYPIRPEPCGAILGVATAETLGAQIFHAGTAMIDGALVANGGRVLTVVGQGPTMREAKRQADAAIARIDAPGLFHRRDIGWRAIAREAEGGR
jgi:phosphoribosylamine--glycine ligase